MEPVEELLNLWGGWMIEKGEFESRSLWGF